MGLGESLALSATVAIRVTTLDRHALYSAERSGMTAPAGLNATSGGRVSQNKRTIEKYIEGFTTGDHEQVLSCLADDVEWDIPGAFRIAGKDAFDREIENPAFTGRPRITTSRMTEENDVVVAEGSVSTQRVDGGFLNLRFCDVFVMHDGKIRQLISYLVEVK